MTTSNEPLPGFGAWFFSCALGLIVLPFAADMVMPLVFGTNKADSSAVWGLSGVVPLIAAFYMSPVYIIGQIASFCFFRNRATPAATFLYSAAVGIALGVVASCLFWKFLEGGTILRAN